MSIKENGGEIQERLRKRRRRVNKGRLKKTNEYRKKEITGKEIN